MQKILLSLGALVLFLTPQTAQAYVDSLDALLKQHVKTVTKNGIQYNGVDYAAWGKDPRHATVRDEILATNPNTLSTKNQKLAFWINAYNVLTIDLITREGETKSIKNLGSTLSSPWKKHKWSINGTEYSLDNIEHKIIRKLDEPRIHFAINCAAKSCPDLRNEAYRADKLDAQLNEQVHLTFKNSTKGFKKVDGQNAVRVTKVMDWFKKDFHGGLNKWLQSYKSDTVNNDTTVQFFKYDWSLNSSK